MKIGSEYHLLDRELGAEFLILVGLCNQKLEVKKYYFAINVFFSLEDGIWTV